MQVSFILRLTCVLPGTRKERISFLVLSCYGFQRTNQEAEEYYIYLIYTYFPKSFYVQFALRHLLL